MIKSIPLFVLPPSTVAVELSCVDCGIDLAAGGTLVQQRRRRRRR